MAHATVPNQHMAKWKENFAKSPDGWNDTPGPSMRQIPSGLASAPVNVIDVRSNVRHEMRFIAGMFGVIEDAAGILAPEFGWAVAYDK